jgi:hypothetical protein
MENVKGSFEGTRPIGDSAMTLTQQRKSVYYVVSDIFIPPPEYHGSIAGLHGSNFFVFYEIYRVNFARKGILVCVS